MFFYSAIVQLKPETANIVNPVTKDLVVVPASAVAEGTTVSVRPGDKVPCDGVVLGGKSTVDESSLSEWVESRTWAHELLPLTPFFLLLETQPAKAGRSPRVRARRCREAPSTAARPSWS